jgi:hypothetical protein
MKIWYLIISVFLFTGCESNNPCKDLKDGVYLYPELPQNHKMTSDDVDKFVDLPQDIADCISTEGLIESILTYPYIGLIFAQFEGDLGYKLLKSHFSGPKVLESRIDRGKELLKKYKEWDPLGLDTLWGSIEIGKYMARGVYLEVLINQYINLENLNSTDFNILFARSLEVYDSEKSLINYYSYAALNYNTATVARLMYLRNYEPFMSQYQTNEYISYLTDFIGPIPRQYIDQVHELAVTYFNTLK